MGMSHLLLWVCHRLIEQDVQEKEEMRKEKKRLQDQLRRIKKMEGQGKHSKLKKDKPKPETTLKVIWAEEAVWRVGCATLDSSVIVIHPFIMITMWGCVGVGVGV